MDYFKAAEELFVNSEKYERGSAYDFFVSDLNRYREYSVRQYNYDSKKGTDEFCFKKFLNEYSVAVNVFSLHGVFFNKRHFNKIIETCRQELLNKKE